MNRGHASNLDAFELDWSARLQAVKTAPKKQTNSCRGWKDRPDPRTSTAATMRARAATMNAPTVVVFTRLAIVHRHALLLLPTR